MSEHSQVTSLKHIKIYTLKSVHFHFSTILLSMPSKTVTVLKTLVDFHHFLLHFNVGVVHRIQERVIISGVATQLWEDDDKGDEGDNADDKNHEEPLLDRTRISLLAAISGSEKYFLFLN